MQFPHLGFTRIYRVDPDGSIFLTCPHESTGLTCPTRERLREFTKDGSRSPTCPHESTDPTCPTRDPLTSLLMTEIRGLWSQLESTGFILLFFSEIVHITSYNSFSILSTLHSPLCMLQILEGFLHELSLISDGDLLSTRVRRGTSNVAFSGMIKLGESFFSMPKGFIFWLLSFFVGFCRVQQHPFGNVYGNGTVVALAFSKVIFGITPTNAFRPLFLQYHLRKPCGRIDNVCIPRACQYIKVIGDISIKVEVPGVGIDALLDHELGLSWVLVRVDHDDVSPQGGVGGQPLESDGDLADDVDEEVVLIVPFLIVPHLTRIRNFSDSFITSKWVALFIFYKR